MGTNATTHSATIERKPGKIVNRKVTVSVSNDRALGGNLRLQLLHNELFSPARERKYKKLKKEIVAEVKSLRLNQARIDALVEQLYEINKRLAGHEGRLMRLAENHGVAREDFLQNYQGAELDPHWLNRVSKLSAKGWKSFVARDEDRIKELRGNIHALATETDSIVQLTACFPSILTSPISQTRDVPFAGVVHTAPLARTL